MAAANDAKSITFPKISIDFNSPQQSKHLMLISRHFKELEISMKFVI